MSSKSKSIIPRNESSWDKLAKAHGATHETVNTIQVMKSGSMVTPEQFLAFRVIWPKRQNHESLCCKDAIINREQMKEMAKTFKKRKAFNQSLQSYLKGIKGNKGPEDVTGVFQLVRKYQMEANNQAPTTTTVSTSVRMSPTPTPGPATSSDGSQGPSQSPAGCSSGQAGSDATPEAEREGQTFERTTDEQYVNQALITFLDSVTENVPGVQCHWGIRRLAFKAEFAQASMEACTDGYLYKRADDGSPSEEAFAIVETKAHLRRRTGEGARIYMQESAEMVAWIIRDERNQREVPLNNIQRLLVSQDRHEIYLTWASYDASYVQYLTDPTFTGKPFMTMQEIGPFKTLNSEHMERLAQYIGCFADRITDLIKKAQAPTLQTQACKGKSKARKGKSKA